MPAATVSATLKTCLRDPLGTAKISLCVHEIDIAYYFIGSTSVKQMLGSRIYSAKAMDAGTASSEISDLAGKINGIVTPQVSQSVEFFLTSSGVMTPLQVLVIAHR